MINRSKAFKRYKDHIHLAKARNIEMKMSFVEWDYWWLLNGVDKNFSTIRNKDQLCMCRLNDEGPYSLDNVYCATRGQNIKDWAKFKKEKVYSCQRIRKGRKGKPIMTPDGRFESKLEAALHYGVKSPSISSRMRHNPKDYYYIVD